MSLIRWSPMPVTPMRELTSIDDEVNRLFDSMFSRGTLGNELNALFTPAVDIEETPEEFVVRMDLPGVSQKDVKVSLMADTLTIRGERRAESLSKDGNPTRLERVYGTFERSFTLGSNEKRDGVKAHYRDGVLEVRVPKAEQARTKEIEIQLG